MIGGPVCLYVVARGRRRLMRIGARYGWCLAPGPTSGLTKGCSTFLGKTTHFTVISIKFQLYFGINNYTPLRLTHKKTQQQP